MIEAGKNIRASIEVDEDLQIAVARYHGKAVVQPGSMV